MYCDFVTPEYRIYYNIIYLYKCMKKKDKYNKL